MHAVGLEAVEAQASHHHLVLEFPRVEIYSQRHHQRSMPLGLFTSHTAMDGTRLRIAIPALRDFPAQTVETSSTSLSIASSE